MLVTFFLSDGTFRRAHVSVLPSVGSFVARDNGCATLYYRVVAVTPLITLEEEKDEEKGEDLFSYPEFEIACMSVKDATEVLGEELLEKTDKQRTSDEWGRQSRE